MLFKGQGEPSLIFLLHITTMAVKLPNSSLFKAIQRHDPDSTAIVDVATGKKFSYGTLFRDALHVKDTLLKKLGRDTVPGERIAFIVENGYNYVGMLSLTSISNAAQMNSRW